MTLAHRAWVPEVLFKSMKLVITYEKNPLFLHNGLYLQTFQFSCSMAYAAFVVVESSPRWQGMT